MSTSKARMTVPPAAAASAMMRVGMAWDVASARVVAAKAARKVRDKTTLREWAGVAGAAAQAVVAQCVRLGDSPPTVIEGLDPRSTVWRWLDQQDPDCPFDRLLAYLRREFPEATVDLPGELTIDDMMPASWFDSEFGIHADRLRAAWRRGDVRSEMREGRRFYSARDARHLWPDDVTILPTQPG